MKFQAALLLIAAGTAWPASVCVPGTLTSYVELGPDGCTIAADGVTFTTPVTFLSFAYSGNLDSIRVVPIPDPNAPALLFYGLEAPGDSLVSAQITFTIDAPATFTDLVMQGYFGDITAQETVCPGSAFAPDGSCPAGAARTFPANQGVNGLAGVTVIGVTDSVTLSDSAFIAYLSNQIGQPAGYGFCECGFPGGGPDPAPEPGTFGLLGFGLAALAAFLLMARWRTTMRKCASV